MAEILVVFCLLIGYVAFFAIIDRITDDEEEDEDYGA